LQLLKVVQEENSTAINSQQLERQLILKEVLFYATSAKIDVLGVSERLINEHSVVSREVVRLWH
jgi:nicotinamide mononucleotide (NMN) deamidase PncC